MGTTSYLTAITISQAASLQISKLRRSIFRDFGMVSALALPSLIPLGWSTVRPIIDLMPRLEKPTQPICTDSIVQSDDKQHWFLEIDLEDSEGIDVIHTWQHLLTQEDDSTPGLFPVTPAVYLFSADQPLSDPDILTSRQLQVKIDDFRLTCFSLQTHDVVHWWNDLNYTQLWSKRLK